MKFCLNSTAIDYYSSLPHVEKAAKSRPVPKKRKIPESAVKQKNPIPKKKQKKMN